MFGIRAIGYAALNRARIEAGLIVANADFIVAEQAIRADRAAHAGRDRPGLHDRHEKGPLQRPQRHRQGARRGRPAACLVGLEIEGNVPAEHAIVYHRKTREVGLVSAAIWSPLAKRNIAIASVKRDYGEIGRDDLWVEIYAMRELQYVKMMKRAKVVARPFIKLDRRTATPPGAF